MPGRGHINLRSACLAAFLVRAIAQPVPLRAETGPQSAPLSAAVQSKAGAEPLAAGVILNGRPAGDLVIYRSGNDYWLPYGMFIRQSGLREGSAPGLKSSYTTSIGVLSFDKGELKVFENVPCISFSSSPPEGHSISNSSPPSFP